MADTSKRDFETPHVMHDAPLRDTDPAKDFYFHFDEFAITLARLIAYTDTRTPLTIGVSGKWGSGKTTLLKRLKWMLDEADNLSDVAKIAFRNDDDEPQNCFRRCRTVWFDAWKYASENQLLVALVRVILNTMAQGGFREKLKSKANDPHHQRGDVLTTLLSAFSIDLGILKVGVDQHKTETPWTQNTAFFDFFDDVFENLLAAWVHGEGDPDKIDERKGALVVFIDDLDRCLPDKTVQVLEAIKLFLDKPGCVFVLGADVSVIQSAVERHYRESKNIAESASDYLEKIIQLRFELPPIPAQEMGAYIDAAGALIDAETRRHWQAIVVGAEINPRKVKTFVNDLNLQWAMLKNSGRAGGVDRDDFTRWQVLMRAAPQSFRKQVIDFPEDAADLRLQFVLEAQKWARGDSDLAAKFRDYEQAQPLRRVLSIIEFSIGFTDKVLDAFVHLAAPPAVVQPKPEEVAEPLKPVAAELRTTLGDISLEAQGAVVAGRERAAVAKGITALERVRTIGDIEFVPVPKGKFIMGSKADNKLAYDDERPQHTVEIPYDYLIARYSVTNAQFAVFAEAAKCVTTAEEEGGWTGKRFQKGYNWRHPFGPKSDWQQLRDHPVVQVSWYDAIEYCKWLTKQLRAEIGELEIRLPTEAEWEKAARGEYGNEWPWGNEFDPARCNSVEGGKNGTTPVGAYSPQGDSPYGAADMVGNVWEWCHSLFKPYPYEVSDGREGESGSDSRVLRGGAFDVIQTLSRAAARVKGAPDDRIYGAGVRLVIAPRLS